MNKYLSKLWEISRKPERQIVGLMSGTALDGLDIALCTMKGAGRDTKIEVREFITQPYPDDFRKRLYAVQSQETLNTRELTLLHSEMGNLFGELILSSIHNWNLKPDDIDLVASHGQTVYHAPAEAEGEVNATLQMVDADHIAQKTGIITVADFRQKHTAVGGEGAPLAGIFDDIFFRDENKHRMLLNLGGIANFSWLPSHNCDQQSFATDTGPANTLINEAMIKYFNQPFDESGKIAARGSVHSELVRYVLLEPYFRKSFPKTTGQEDFQLTYIEELMEGHRIELSPQDLVASLTSVTSQSIARAVDDVIGDQPFECYVSGGGIHNQTIMQDLKKRIPQADFRSFEELGLEPDAKEAAIMAFFANELVAGEGFVVPGITDEKVHLGKISLPG